MSAHDKVHLQSLQIPLEIYIICLESPQVMFGARELAQEMESRFNIEIKRTRISQIAKTLVEGKRLLLIEQRRNGQPIYFYQLDPRPHPALLNNQISRNHLAFEMINTIQELSIEHTTRYAAEEAMKSSNGNGTNGHETKSTHK